MNEEQAQKGLDALKERQAEGEYFGRMWMAQIEKRISEGEPLTELIEAAAETARCWEGVASTSCFPTGPQQETVTRLLEAVA